MAKNEEKEIKEEKTTTKKVAPKVETESNEKGLGTNAILFIAVIIVIIIAIFLTPGGDNNGSSLKLSSFDCEKTEDNINNDTKLDKISCNGYNEAIKRKEDTLILIARPTCGYCAEFTPILEEIVEEYDIELLYFDTDTLTNDERNDFYNSGALYTNREFGTPTLIITNNKEIKKYTIGKKDKDAAVNWLKTNGIISE